MGRKGMKLFLLRGEHAGVPTRLRAQAIEEGAWTLWGSLKLGHFVAL